MGHFADECYSDTKKKGKEEKANVAEETEEESALMMVVFDEFGELPLQGTMIHMTTACGILIQEPIVI